MNDQTHSADGPSAGTPWSTIAFPRDGAPPLRVSCRCLAEGRMPLAEGEDIVLGLWERKTGGFVVVHSVLDADVPVATATQVDDIETAMTLVEGSCAGLQENQWALPPRIDAPGVSLVSAISDLGRQSDRVRAFLLLAGKALADWQQVAQRDLSATTEQ